MIGVHSVLLLLPLDRSVVPADYHIGAFVAAPVGGLIFALLALGLRLGYKFVLAKATGGHFDAFDRPLPRSRMSPALMHLDEPEFIATGTDATIRNNDEEGAKFRANM